MTYRNVSHLRYHWKVPAPKYYQLNKWGDTREGILDLTVRREVANGKFYLLLNSRRISDQWFESETEALRWGMEVGKKEQEARWAKNDPVELIRAKERQRLGQKVIKWS